MSRSGRVGHMMLAAALAAGCGSPKKDSTPPVFAGLETATSPASGTAHLSWSAATDDSKITYDVYAASSAGGENYLLAPIATTTQTQIDVTGLPGGALPSFFVVRAVDSHGNRETNSVEKSTAFATNRVQMLSSYPTPIASDIAVSADGHVVAMGSFINTSNLRAYVFDVTDPANPVLKATLYGPGRTTDVEIHGTQLWVSTEDEAATIDASIGAFVYDISNLDAISQTPMAQLDHSTHSGLEYCHTLWLDDDVANSKTWLYCASTSDGDIHVLDATNPAAPVQVSQVGIPGGQIHDMYVKGNFGIGSFLSDGWAFIDFTDKAAPILQQRYDYAQSFTHNAWPTDDLHYLYTTDEDTNGHLRIWDISDHANAVQVGEYIADPLDTHHAIVHNVHVVGNTAFVSWYEDGVQVLDITDPVHPQLIGFFDTFTQPTQGYYDGDWGVAPYPPYLYLSDLDSGFYALKLN